MKITKKSLDKELNSFYYYFPCINLAGDDMCICTCGNINVISPDRVTYKISDESSMFNINDEHSLNHLLLGKRIINSRCSKCEKDLSTEDVTSKLQNLNSKFFERFYVNENKNFLELKRVRGEKKFNLKEKYSNNEIEESYIRINKKSNRVFIKQFSNNKHKQINLDTLFVSIIEFFKKNSETSYSDGYIFVHDWIGRLARMIRDAKHMNIIDELLNYMTGKSGFDIIAKIAVIFTSIIIYPNLSTISLTKGNVFLFDLIANCNLPDKSYLQKHKATSPIKIFNLLVSLKNKKLQTKLDTDDLNKLDFIHSTDERKTGLINLIKKEHSNLMDENDRLKKNNGKIFIRDEIYKRTVSPLWFNHIKQFSDYEKTIEWLRIVKYEQFIELLNKYNINLLLNAYQTLQFRDDLEFDRIKQFLDLMTDYCYITLHLEPGMTINNYSPVLHFDYNLFDDCYRMIIELKWEPKKVLYKVKTLAKLHELHENLLKHRSYVSNSDVNEKFIEFSEKFKFLESYSENIDINLKIELIQTPEELMNHAVEMHNCAGSYVRKVANGQYLSFIVYDESPQRTKEEFYKYMMVLEITSLGLEFVGIKSRFNKYGSNRFKEDMKKYLIDKDINFKDVPSIKSDIQSNEVSYKGFFENIIKDL